MDAVMGCLADTFLSTQEYVFLTAPKRPDYWSKEHQKHYHLAERKATCFSEKETDDKFINSECYLVEEVKTQEPEGP